jgi:hypothetical protein
MAGEKMTYKSWEWRDSRKRKITKNNGHGIKEAKFLRQS